MFSASRRLCGSKGRRRSGAGLERAGVAGQSERVAVTATRPGLHPTVFNQEFSVNSSPNPAPAGGAVVLNTTGRGVTSPEGHFSPVGQRPAGAGRANRPAQPGSRGSTG
jgi:hypothetical protein